MIFRQTKLWILLVMCSLSMMVCADSLIKLQPERLPDMNIPRLSHSTLLINGELTVVGGHTSGFVPTKTAEYLKDGEWHVMQMAYNHDDGLCVPLRNGKVLLAGGYEKNLGVGQTIEAELYDRYPTDRWSWQATGITRMPSRPTTAACISKPSVRCQYRAVSPVCSVSPTVM